MRGKQLISALLIPLVVLPASAQTSAAAPVRVRISGVERYDVPDVVHVERDRVSGHGIRVTGSFVQWQRAGDPQVVSVLLSGSRVTGRAVGVTTGLLEFVPDQAREHVFIPLDSIRKLEEPVVPRPGTRAAWVTASVLAGVGVFFLVALGFLSACGDEGGCGGGTALFGWSIGGGTATGAALASNGRTRWLPVSIEELERRLTRPR
jgi:hypothetical protein